MHGDLHRIAIDQRLDSLGLVSVGQLVCCINIDLNLASGSLFYQLTELSSALSPGTGLRGGTGEVPGLLFPSEVAVILYGICTDGAVGFFGKGSDQLSCILVALIFQFLLIPLSNTGHRILKGIDIDIFVLCDRHAVCILPTIHDLCITGTVDVTLIIDRLHTGLIHNRLLLRRQLIIDFLVDTEEEAVIVCIP